MAIHLDDIDSAFHSIVVEDGGGSISIDDNGGSVTVDGTVELGATTLSALESITVQNGAGGAAVNIQDGGNSITVDGTVAISGTVAVTQSTSPWVVSATDLDIRDLVFATDKVDVSGSAITTTEGGYATWSVTALSVTTTESSITALGSRVKIEMQNLGANDIYIRHVTGVTTANGFKIPKGSSWEQTLAAGASIFMVAAAGSADIRVAQYAV